MKRSDTLEERVHALFEAARFKMVMGPGEVLVEETEKEGFAQIVCRVGEGHRVITWKLQSGDFRPMASEKTRMRRFL